MEAYGEPGQYLFHYTRAATAFEQILPRGEIRLSPYGDMRDPLEAQHWPEPPAYFVDDSDPDQERLEMARMSVVIQAKAAARLLSLTVDADYGEDTEPFGRGYGRASLWQLYGDNHRGVCLAFDRQALIDKLKSELADSARFYARPVSYAQALRPDVLPPKPDDLTVDGFRRAVENYLEQSGQELLFTKLRDWSGEQEFRVVAVRHDDTNESLDVSFGDTLRAVICGHELPGWQRAGGEVICREAGDVDLVRCMWFGRRPVIVRDVKGFGER